MAYEHYRKKREQLRAFGPIWDGAGARGFANEGYWYHRYIPGLNFDGSTPVTKTVTAYPTAGNMALDLSYEPSVRFPDCIHINFVKGYALNAVGLSGPGIAAILSTGRWQAIEEPFFISFMPVLTMEDDGYGWEVHDFVATLKRYLPEFKTRKLGVQINISCPNVGANLSALVAKASRLLDAFQSLRYRNEPLPIIVKINLLTPQEAAYEIASHPACSGLCVANSVAFGTVLPAWWWEENFPNGSPLTVRGYGAGGLSGAPLLPYVIDWIRAYREFDLYTYMNAGGGITAPHDVNLLCHAGADSVSFATAAMLRPWRIKRIIQRAHSVFRNYSAR